jgi:hypothetical protein
MLKNVAIVAHEIRCACQYREIDKTALRTDPFETRQVVNTPCPAPSMVLVLVVTTDL